MAFLVALVAAFSIGHTYRTLPAALAPTLAGDLALDPWALGVYGAAFNLTFAAMQIPIGFALDRVDLRRLVVALLTAAIAGALLLAAANGLAALVASQVLIGIGCSGLWLACCVHIARIRPPGDFAWISTIAAAVGSSGMFLTTTPLALVLERAGWRVAAGLVAALTLLLVGWVALAAAGAGTRPTPGAGIAGPASLRALLAVPRVFACVLLGLVSYGSLLAIRGLWVGPFLEGVHGLSPTRAGTVAFAVSVVMIAAPLAFGYADRRGADRRALLAAAFAIAGLALVALGLARPGIWTAAGLLVLFAASASAFVLQYADVRAAAPEGQAGRALSVLNLAFLIGVAGCQIGAGAMLAVLDRSLGTASAYGAAFASIGALLVAAAIAYAVLTRR
ncbi:MAG: MFS transporter [Alphaproteobacteria bacterium]|nr:MFS transporter [Alphaproteobacteria bacterium]